ncbi:MAG: YceI family protein, partial [Rhodothermaceae bacterium]|nr:YceI family protein [Rhodothermaceae bacterium]
DWDCAAEQLTGTVDAEPTAERFTALGGVSVSVPAARIDCDNGIMNGKLRDALQADAHPTIRYTLTSARVGTVNNGRFGIEATGQLSIAGATRTVRVPASGQALGNGRFRITGRVPLTMTQFGIDPPTAMMGTMRTGDAVTVHFDVTVSR